MDNPCSWTSSSQSSLLCSLDLRKHETRQNIAQKGPCTCKLISGRSMSASTTLSCSSYFFFLFTTIATLILISLLQCANCDSSSSSYKNNNNKNGSNNSTNITQQLYLYSLKTNLTVNSSSTSSTATVIQSENYKVNIRNLERVSRMIHDGRMKSACVQAGLWAIFYSQNFANIAAVLYASSNSADQTCTQNQLNETDFSQYKSARYVGNSNLLASGLSLYKGSFFSLEELYIDGGLLSLPSSQLFHSYGFTGNESWTLYQHTNFTGHTICLMASGGNVEDVITNTFDRVVYNKNKGVDFEVGSVQRGCSQKSNRTLIFPSGETVVQWTNKPIGAYDDDDQNLGTQIHQNKFPSLKLISELDGNILITDANQLRLPQKYTFNRFIVNTGKGKSKREAAREDSVEDFGEEGGSEEKEITWTVFSGTEFTGKSKCFHSSTSKSKMKSSNLNQNDSTLIEPNNDLNIDFSVPYRSELFLVGSIKTGCFESNETEELPVLELHLSDEDEVDDEHENSLFFISFIIGLILLVIVILLSIGMIVYFYVKTKRRREREEREARAMRS